MLSIVGTINTKPLKAAEITAERKTNKHKEIAATHQDQFVPFAIETFGEMGSHARRMVKKLALFAVKSMIDSSI